MRVKVASWEPNYIDLSNSHSNTISLFCKDEIKRKEKYKLVVCLLLSRSKTNLILILSREIHTFFNLNGYIKCSLVLLEAFYIRTDIKRLKKEKKKLRRNSQLFENI